MTNIYCFKHCKCFLTYSYYNHFPGGKVVDLDLSSRSLVIGEMLSQCSLFFQDSKLCELRREKQLTLQPF